MVPPDPKKVLQQLAAALPLAESSPDCPAEVVEALRASERLIKGSLARSLCDQHAGSICWTFEDDEFEPNGREIDVVIYYDWDDYSAGDGVTPSSGGCAQIANIKVSAVRYFDERGEVIDYDQHCLDAAWEAVERHREQLEESCSDAGHRDSAGRTDPIRFVGSQSSLSAQSTETASWRMAPSARQRSGRGRNLKQG